MRRLVILAGVVATLMLLAIPAVAQVVIEEEPTAGDPLTWEALGTVGGAAVAAGVVVQVAGLIVSLSARAKRLVAVASGIVIVVAVAITTSEPGAAVVGLAIYNGMLAGLAASQFAQMLQHGLGHRVLDAPSKPLS